MLSSTVPLSLKQKFTHWAKSMKGALGPIVLLNALSFDYLGKE